MRKKGSHTPEADRVEAANSRIESASDWIEVDDGEWIRRDAILSVHIAGRPAFLTRALTVERADVKAGEWERDREAWNLPRRPKGTDQDGPDL